MLSNYIRAWRKHRGLTQKELAARMERSPGEELMSYVTISKIERGEQSPTLEQLQALGFALNVKVSALIENDPTKDGEVVDLLSRINENNRDTVIAILKAAIGE